METVYIETTIVSYLVAGSSRDLVVAAHQQATRDWWQNRRQEFVCLCSPEVIREASLGDPDQVARRLAVLATLPQVAVTAQAETTANAFLATGALPPLAQPDALHLAIATTAEVDFLMTWNCRHLANAQIQRRLEQEAVRMGWKLPVVCTPLELMGDLSV
jgi:hypothetical protein